ncbi:uncharacterized protein [Nicotiana sylvestris]|uniref:Uncharacterized protein LOC104238951 isoform X2 n=1 Tax=Nicotiana sylvestris TaxID=4096 RepID=A0A1U7XY31_NICSY|nr:PREDICTED: uncharacterized protein LOC104238951 isoform X2 [Nicotiana sylvestris]
MLKPSPKFSPLSVSIGTRFFIVSLVTMWKLCNTCALMGCIRQFTGLLSCDHPINFVTCSVSLFGRRFSPNHLSARFLIGIYQEKEGTKSCNERERVNLYVKRELQQRKQSRHYKNC